MQILGIRVQMPTIPFDRFGCFVYLKYFVVSRQRFQSHRELIKCWKNEKKTAVVVYVALFSHFLARSQDDVWRPSNLHFWVLRMSVSSTVIRSHWPRKCSMNIVHIANQMHIRLKQKIARNHDTAFSSLQCNNETLRSFFSGSKKNASLLFSLFPFTIFPTYCVSVWRPPLITFHITMHCKRYTICISYAQ